METRSQTGQAALVRGVAQLRDRAPVDPRADFVAAAGDPEAVPVVPRGRQHAFGQHGPRGNYTAYDHVIQANSGIMATTGEQGGRPIKFGSPVIDYATGTTGAFALATALFQRERTGKGQHIDMAMMDVALVMMASQIGRAHV